MKNKLLILSLAIFGTLMLINHDAQAQISTNLDALPSHQESSQQVKKAQPHIEHHISHKVAQPTISAPSKEKETTTHIPAIPNKAPLEPNLSLSFPTINDHPPVPADIIIPIKDVQNKVISLNHQNLRIVFSKNSADLNPTTIDSVHNFGTTIAHYPEKRLVLKSYATMEGDDISTSKRIALTRALAIRSLLMQADIPSTRIYPIAYGAPDQHSTETQKFNDDHDYVDIIIEENPHMTSIPFTLPPQ